MAAININKLCDFAKLRDCFSIKRIEGGKPFRLGVQHKCLKSWYDLKGSPDISYVQIINGFLERSPAVLVKERSDRIEIRVNQLEHIASQPF